ncbi:hypothetical protein O181_003726 [Austropuccinia psidii MF-1]|uniref:Uncharacterized protein n=1 Tax=Austropuccinia psidii MF-1 TaxID=1389203 RepID=A0A9Q3BE77_9BASI|nr:hypothetical protein [Austropuccinia psidii MF-1]
MPIQHSPPERQTRSQARTQAALTPTPRAPVDGTPAGPGEDGEEEEENSVEKEESDGTEGAPALVGVPQGTGGPTLAQSYQPVSHQSGPSLLAIMQQMTQIMANLQVVSSPESSRPQAFKNPSMKAPKCFDGTKPFKVRSFIQSCQLIFHNDQQTSLKTERRFSMPPHFSLAGLQNGLSLICPISPIKTQITLSILGTCLNLNSLLYLGTKIKSELDSLKIKEGGHVSLYIANFRSSVSRIGDWGERALIHHFRKGLPCRILDHLSPPSIIDSLQDLMDVTLEFDTRYHERKKEKNPEASKFISSHPQNSSSSSNKKKKNFWKRDKPNSSLLNKDFQLMNSEKERRIKEGICTYCVIDNPKGEDIILGFDFLNHLNPSIDWRQGLITFNSDHKDYCEPSKSFSNDFPSAKSCAALVGDSRTPSFPSSVHIPSFNSHLSLLLSRDEVFKDIQDVGEDNSVSSLHLFFGNMDLPPSSYCDSLEELWDEEEELEEVENVFKVVTSAYHLYLNVFSKLKAKKLPPHRACDHHIKLEGSLPPVGAISSLSNKESDTIRA